MAIADSAFCGYPVLGYSYKPPSRVNYIQIQKVVVKWLTDHPQNQHELSSVLVAKALQETWPCAE